MDLLRVAAAVKNFLHDTDLLHVALVGVRVVCVNDAGRIQQLSLLVQAVEKLQILIVVVRQTLTMLADCAS